MMDATAIRRECQMATPNLKEGVVTVIDIKDWRTVKEIRTLWPGFFMRSHENTRYAWVDAMMSPRKDTLQVIDKQTLEVDAESLKEVKRIPMKKPSGKYNVYNKITRSEGTSH